MNAIRARNQLPGTRPSPADTSATAAIDRSLVLLTEGGFDFEVVVRCPSPCGFCDPAVGEAA
jgi:hypothetical protein